MSSLVPDVVLPIAFWPKEHLELLLSTLEDAHSWQFDCGAESEQPFQSSLYKQVRELLSADNLTTSNPVKEITS